MGVTIQENEKLLQKLIDLSMLQEKKQMPRQILFVSDDTDQLSEVALAVAKIMLCSNASYLPDCVCLNCQKINNESYYDVTILGNFNETIKKESILDLIQKNNLTSLEAKTNKIYIIKEVNNITLEGSNALLKFLEEPPQNTYAILLTKNINLVLETIKSRCLIIKLTSNDYFVNKNSDFHSMAIKYLKNLQEKPKLNYLWINEIKKLEKKEKKLILSDIIILLYNQSKLLKNTLEVINATIELITKLDENFNEELLWQNYVIISNGE